MAKWYVLVLRAMYTVSKFTRYYSFKVCGDTKSLTVNDQRTLEDPKEDIVNVMLKGRDLQMTIVCWLAVECFGVKKQDAVPSI